MMYCSYSIFVLMIIYAVGVSSNSADIPSFSRGKTKDASSNLEDVTKPKDYEILSENVVYKNWRTIIQRKVKTPKGQVIDFDVVGQNGSAGASIVFAWNTSTKTATLCREYNPGPHKVLAGLAAGLVEDKHDEDFLTAAQHELEEEIHLKGGTWHVLTPKTPVAMDKYSNLGITAFLVLDPIHVENPKPLDEEEDIEIVNSVTVPEIMEMIQNGQMNVVGSWASLLAISKLRSLGEIP